MLFQLHALIDHSYDIHNTLVLFLQSLQLCLCYGGKLHVLGSLHASLVMWICSNIYCGDRYIKKRFRIMVVLPEYYYDCVGVVVEKREFGYKREKDSRKSTIVTVYLKLRRACTSDYNGVSAKMLPMKTCRLPVGRRCGWRFGGSRTFATPMMYREPGSCTMNAVTQTGRDPESRHG